MSGDFDASHPLPFASHAPCRRQLGERLPRAFLSKAVARHVASHPRPQYRSHLGRRLCSSCRNRAAQGAGTRCALTSRLLQDCFDEDKPWERKRSLTTIEAARQRREGEAQKMTLQSEIMRSPAGIKSRVGNESCKALGPLLSSP